MVVSVVVVALFMLAYAVLVAELIIFLALLVLMVVGDRCLGDDRGDGGNNNVGNICAHASGSCVGSGLSKGCSDLSDRGGYGSTLSSGGGSRQRWWL